MVGDHKADGKKTGSLDAEFQDDMTTRRSTSTKIKDGFGITREDKAAIRVAYQGDGIKVSMFKDNLNGFDTALGPKNDFNVMLCTYMPLTAPVGLYKASAKVSSENGGSAKPVVIQPDCRLVDLYMTVDGKSYEQMKFCCGEGNLENADAMKKAMQKCYGEYEVPLKRQIEGGPQAAGPKPWVTLFGKDSFRGEFFVYLPLMVPQGDDVDSVMVDEVKEYGEGLMLAWTQLLHEVGPGKHTFELRFAPRCVIYPQPGEGEGYHEGLSVIEGYGKTTKLNSCGDPGTILRENLDKTFNDFCAVWDGKDIVPDPENPLFKATFTLDLDAAICTGRGAERKVEEFDKDFNDDVEEYCMIAYNLAGAASGPARKAFGKSPGKPSHIVLPERADYSAGNVFESEDKDGNKYRHFLANAYWLHPDGGDDDEGVSSMMFMKKYTVRKWQAVPNPEFEVITPGSEWGVVERSQRYLNKNIRAAIERDSSLWSAPGDDEQ